MKTRRYSHWCDIDSLSSFIRFGFILSGFFMLAPQPQLSAQTTDFTIESWRWNCGSNFVTVDFSTNVNSSLATDPANYLFNPPVTISNIIHTSPSHVVVLEVYTLSTIITNVLTVTNVTSIAGEPLDPQYSQAFLYCHNGDDDDEDDEPCEVLCPDDLFALQIDDCPAFMPDVTPYITLSGNCDPTQYTFTQDIPVGTPLSNGTFFVNVTVTGPGGFEEDCRITVVNECEDEPFPPGGPCDNVLSAIPVNTGWNHNSNTTYSIGDVDAFWTVIDDPDPGTTEPRPAIVINQHPAWQPAMPDSQWISAYAIPANNLNGAYDLEFIFCLVEGWSNAVVDIALRVDDRAEVYLNSTLIGQTPPLFSFAATNPTVIVENNQALFQTGTNSLMVRMINSHGVAMGLNVAGEIRGDGLALEDPLCCDPGSSISGQKFYDANQNGIFDPNETVLAGWTIEATDGTNVWTAVTDVNGYYYFMGLPPGTYTITEVQQPNFIQTAPVGGSHVVTVGLAQGVSGLDFGNYREIKEPNQPPIVECPEDLIIDCVNGGTNVTLTANFSDADGDPLTYSWFINGSLYTSGGIPAGGPPTIGSSTITPFLAVGTNVITVTVNDGSAEDACTFTVVIGDYAPPILHCRDEGIIVLPVNDDCEAELPAMPYVITPGCTPLSDLIVTQNPPVGTLLGPGIHWVTLEVYDPATGLSLYCRFQVQVVDLLPPRIICPEVEPVDDCEAEIPDLIPSVEIIHHCDPDADLTIVQTPPAGTVVGPGTHTITITVTDAAGNVTQCTTVFDVLAIGDAIPIDGLRNTGVNLAGSLLPLDAVDPNYELTTSANPAAPGPEAYVMDPRPGAWVANTAVSQWISPTNTLSTHTVGAYVYEFEFTLPATFSSASISGLWATDNSAEIYLNGIPTGITKNNWGFQNLAPFTLTSGFVPGVNVLEFRINVISQYTGLHVSELEGIAYTCEDPEPCVPPSVLVWPFSGQTVAWGGSATFSALVGGTPPFSYQWFFNGAPLPGETNATLTVNFATHANAGLYHVEVVNPCGEVSSRRSRLRVRRPWVVVIDTWVIGRPFDPPQPPDDPPDPLEPRPIIGDLGTPLEPLPLGPDPLDPYEGTAAASQFGRSTEFGIPGPDGVPVDVMQFTYGFPGTGYALTYDPAELPQQTLVMDVFVSEETSYLPLLSFDSDEGDDTVVKLNYTGTGETTGIIAELSHVPPGGTWVRLTIAVDADQGSLHGHVLLREGGTRLFDIYGTVPPGNGIIRFLPSGADDHGVLYVHSLAWFSKVLTDLEITALGAASSRGIPVEDPVWNRSRAGVSIATYSGGLSLRWESGDFMIQRSTNLVDWESISLEPVLVTDTENEVEYRIDLPTDDQPMLFYRGNGNISPDIYTDPDDD